MKFGLSLFGLGPRHYPEIAALAEENGFESVWMPEHLVLPAEMPSTYIYTESGQPPIAPNTAMYDPWVVLGAISQATQTIRLATNVYILPLRHPFQTARTVVTLDRLSRGRVTLGIGVGWLEEEFVAAGQSFHDRGARTNEIIELLRRLWSEEVIEQHAEFFDFEPVMFAPKPVNPTGIPIEVGGSSKAALRRAGRIGDGWIEIGAGSLERVAEMLEVVNAARRDAGRDHLPFEVTSSQADTVDDIRRAEELGVTRVTRGPTPSSSILGDPTLKNARLTPDDFSDWVKRFGSEVIARVQ
jgi:probable F420-dependent oxidoreductase